MADQQQPEVPFRRQAWTADLVSVESLTPRFDVSIEVRPIEDLVQSRVCFGRGRRLPIAMHPSVRANDRFWLVID